MSTIVENTSRRPRWIWALAGAGLLAAGLLLGYLLFGVSDGPGGPGGPDANGSAHVHDDADAGMAEMAASTQYTCSMHPQIIREEPGDCPICGMDLIPMSAASDDPTVLQMTEAAVALARVQTSPVRRLGERAMTDVELAEPAIAVSGRLTADETRAATQTAHVPGRIERLLVGFEGERVSAGQRIAEVYSPQLVSAQEELLQASRAGGDALLAAARAKLRNLRVSDAEIDAVLASGEPRNTFPVYADVGGVVTDKRVEVGDYVQTGQTLYTLADLSTLYAEFDVYEDQLSAVQTGDRVSFTTPAVPGRTFTGRINFIDPLIDPATRTATVRAEVANAGGRLKPEMLIRGELQARGGPAARAGGGSEGEPLVVPASAVLWTGERSVVYVETEDAAVPSYEFREVSLGERAGGAYVVTAGLSAGERVVTNGTFSLDAAAQLNNQFSMMNRDILIEGAEAQAAATFVALPDYRDGTPASFRQQLAAAAAAYLPLKDALVAGELGAARAAVAGFGESLNDVDMMLLPEADVHDYWMQQLKAMRTHGAAIASAPNLDEARRQFAFLSTALISAVEVFGLPPKPDVTLYKQHCPMAFDNEGANWLSAEAPIRNPYFGDAMLTCGSTLDTLSGGT